MKIDIEHLTEIIAEAMYEVGNEGVWENLPENKKELWLLDAGYVAEDVMSYITKIITED